jgi:hypothetical protein
MILDEVFEDLKVQIAKGATLPTPQVPEVEEDLKPFILRPMTDDEVAFMAARDAADLEARKMIARVAIARRFGLLNEATPHDIERDEKTKFRALLLGDLFFWSIQAATGWEFASLYQRRTHEGKLVLIGLKTPDALAYLKKQEEAQDMAELIDEYQGPRLVN